MFDYDNFVEAMDSAGYSEHDEILDFLYVREFNDRFEFVLEDPSSSETYSINKFFKATDDRMADFGGEPVSLHKSPMEAVELINNK